MDKQNENEVENWHDLSCGMCFPINQYFCFMLQSFQGLQEMSKLTEIPREVPKTFLLE